MTLLLPNSSFHYVLLPQNNNTVTDLGVASAHNDGDEVWWPALVFDNFKEMMAGCVRHNLGSPLTELYAAGGNQECFNQRVALLVGNHPAVRRIVLQPTAVIPETFEQDCAMVHSHIQRYQDWLSADCLGRSMSSVEVNKESIPGHASCPIDVDEDVKTCGVKRTANVGLCEDGAKKTAKIAVAVLEVVQPPHLAIMDAIGRDKTGTGKYDVVWNTMYSELVAYKEVHGNCIVPCKAPAPHQQLASWVHSQRYRCKDAKRREKLDKIGFVWHVRPKYCVKRSMFPVSRSC